MYRRYWGIWLLLILAALLTGCGTETDSSANDVVSPGQTQAATAMPDYHWSQLLGRDDILPIYDPQFVPADQAGYADEELVMGVEIGGEAKAYPIGLLRSREMVNDELAGIPILVTW